MLFESNAFGDKPYGGQVTVARIEGATISLPDRGDGAQRPVVRRGAGDRVYAIESKYGLLIKRKEGDGPVSTGAPFDIQ